MRNIITTILIVILVLLIVLIVLGLGFALVSAIAFGLGVLLRWALPTLSLFEATLLGTIFGVITLYAVRVVAGNFLPDELTPGSSETGWRGSDDSEADEYQTIPQERFFADSSSRTWEAWLEAELANDIYAEFQEAPDTVSNLNPMQIQELSIRLAEAGVNIIQRKTGRSRHLSCNLNDLRRELNRNGQKAYDEDILRMALAAINMNLNFYEDALRDVIRSKSWNHPATIPETEE